MSLFLFLSALGLAALLWGVRTARPDPNDSETP